MTSAADLSDGIDALQAMGLSAEAQIAVQNEILVERDGIIERKGRLHYPARGVAI